MNEIVTTICGYVATEPHHQTTKGGRPRTTFRLASTPRTFDQETQAYVDKETTWLTVTCWNALALNAGTSLHKGQPVVVQGSLRTREWLADDGRTRYGLELNAFTVGHDLRRGVALFDRVNRQPGRAEAEAAAEPTADRSQEPARQAADGVAA